MSRGLEHIGSNENWSLTYWACGLLYQITLIWIDTWCARWLYWDYELMDQLQIKYRWRRWWPVLEETIFWTVTGSCYCIISCYWKLMGKDWLTVTPCTLLLFIVYMVTNVYCPDYCSPCIRLLLTVILYC